MNEIKIVIGSWGSYNECNERALGSKWLNLSDYSSWEEIEKELANEGFELDGLDEELFIQDIEGIDCKKNWDYTHPKTCKVEMVYFTDDRSYDDFERLVANYGSNWDDDIHIYKNYDWSDYGKMMFDVCCYQVPDIIENFIDFEAYGKYMGDFYAQEYQDGIIEIVR